MTDNFTSFSLLSVFANRRSNSSTISCADGVSLVGSVFSTFALLACVGLGLFVVLIAIVLAAGLLSKRLGGRSLTTI